MKLTITVEAEHEDGPRMTRAQVMDALLGAVDGLVLEPSTDAGTVGVWNVTAVEEA